VTFFTGLFAGLSLIVAIGAQNAFVLRQGLRREHVIPIAALCALADAVLIFAGVAGIGVIVEKAPVLLDIVRWGGVAFLLTYAALSVRRAMHPAALETDGMSATSLRSALLTAAALTFLNPHVYLDTLVLLGSIANQHGEPGRWVFAAGATVGSFAWFFGLGLGARALAPVFARQRAWQVLDVLIALVMVAIATSLALSA
jgi:L-lysine exporter family protein LysE/ArgO